MTWNGYYEFDGVEVVNTARFEAYTSGVSWFTPAYRDSSVATVIYDGILVGGLAPAYTNPADDLAPWYDPNVAVSADFWGAYPITVVGMEDSTQGSTVTESTNDGGTPGRTRFSTKQVVFSFLIAGASDEAVEYGQAWMRKTLLGVGSDDTRNQGLGYDVSYFSTNPIIGEDESAYACYQRTFRRRRHAAVTGPLTRTGGREKMSCGSALRTVQFTVTFGDPFEYGSTVDVLSNWLADNPDGDTVWLPTDVPDGTPGDPDTIAEIACNPPVWLPLSDPLCPAIVSPPTPPSVALGCWLPPTAWSRYPVRLDEALFPSAVEMMPVITVENTEGAAYRGLRLRLYSDPTGDMDPTLDTCDWLSDMVISYLPPYSAIRIDCANQRVTASSASVVRSADSVVYNTKGEPLKWPALAGGGGFLMALDIPNTWSADLPVVDLALIPRYV